MTGGPTRLQTLQRIMSVLVGSRNDHSEIIEMVSERCEDFLIGR
eukprot:CAMPEP_0171346196 /NCGR_PEP_ID=MMETSP0878-20121228/23946_1 /TAXON_ID=67004 /ORGANISM="Thalassiosira weissflogii, Strain CCMP1336" /LENGTH=43 /DNA_ID= /DNA_START= /DNA_END= /DNA_ORIENTATION=